MPAIDITKPPQTPPAPQFRLPPTYETTMPHGLRLVVLEDRRFPLVTVRLGFQAGAKFEPEDLPGLAEATSDLLTEGTASRTSRQIAEELAAIGGRLSAGAGSDTLVASGSVLAENLTPLVDLLADVTLHANFPEDEIAIHKNNRLQELLAERSQAAFWADEKLAAVVFGSHPYSRIHPTPESIERLDRSVLVEFRDRHLAPDNAVLILLGALPPRDEVLKLVESQFGGWTRRDTPSGPAPAFPDPERSITLVDRPGSVQADIRIGRLAVNRSSPDYFPLLVVHTVLGGGASSRLFMNIREKKGYAYQAASSLQPRKDGGLFTVITQVRNEVLEPAIEGVHAEMEALGKEPVGDGELDDVKNFLSGTFVMGLETQNGLAGQLAAVKLMGLPDDYLEKYTARIRSVKPSEIQAVARKYVSPEAAAIVVVGDASQVGKSLEQFGAVRVVKAE